ncbi:DNA polymerase, partial [Calidithermus chliarophilus]|uniref:DNA polymerase n=1 Tax=Calidithermus chliarophilus TaxID=52023 RepID=UPI001FE016AD
GGAAEASAEPYTAPVVGVAGQETVLLDGTGSRPVGLGELPSPVNAVDAKALVRQALWAGRGLEAGDDPLLMAYVEDTRVTTPEKLAERHARAAWPAAAAERAALTRALLGTLRAGMRPASRRLYEEVERPLATVLAHMEATGIRFDVEQLAGLTGQLRRRLAELEAAIQELVGRPFKVSSRDQLEALLFDELGLAPSRQTALTNKRSTDNETLSALRDAHPVVPLILEHRELAKLVGTYLEPLPRWVNPQTGRLHTTFDQTNAATGRLASLNPNLQNIPIRTEAGRPIRGAFCAAEGYRLVSADYSQIELRILAHLSGDPTLVRAFALGEDIHRITAARVAGIALEAVTREQRSQAKTINYGLSYGLSAVGLAERTGMSRGEASRFIKRYFEEYPGIEAYVRETKRLCKEHGYVEDLFGRRRYIPDINAPGAAIRVRAENAAINMPVQGACASIIKKAMVEAFPALCELGARLLLQVHDELVVEAPEDRVEEVGALLRKTMTGVVELAVPLEVEVGHGKTWLEAHGG